jgi:NADPH:quinone reductase-like Zn-dependent oxidoreductase
MKAAVNTGYGPPEVVRILEVAKPTAKHDEVLVRVHATTVNRTDCGFRAARPFLTRFLTGLLRPRARVQGGEFTGEVEAVGADITSFGVGDRVFGFTGWRFGAHAEYLTIPEDGSLATIPASLTYEQAAPSTEGAVYALSSIRTAKIRLVGCRPVVAAPVLRAGYALVGRRKAMFRPPGMTGRRCGSSGSCSSPGRQAAR